MSDKLNPLSFEQLTSWIFSEYKYSKSIISIPEEKWHRYPQSFELKLSNKILEAPIGPAAGPHTQMAQNIISAYLTGSRFFELKTVQIIDDLNIARPCIDAADEGYNVEWSQELKLQQSYDEYLKAWILIHVLNEVFHFAPRTDIIFNMSVGYDLKGIMGEPVNNFIDGLLNAANRQFSTYKDYIRKLKIIDENIIDSIPADISNSVTLSTMHGCPPEEIESIVKYLITEKGLHTYVKLNPTLLSYSTVREILNTTGYNYIELSRENFGHDLKMSDAVKMLKYLKHFAEEHNKEFGIKLSNTLPVRNNKGILKGEQMYLSGQALFPLTINLAAVIAAELNGDIRISFSGGASVYNTSQILSTGISPVTFVTDLLKPGGYLRIKQTAESISGVEVPARLRLDLLKTLAQRSLSDNHYHKNKKKLSSPKSSTKRKCMQTDVLCSRCVEVCPNRANVLLRSGEGANEKQLIVHIHDLCNECGNCETFCPVLAIPHKDKYSISFSEDLFDPDLFIRDYPPDPLNPHSIRKEHL